ncbi:hypothetical protein P3T76_003522 [Phytophthora citrophthora]|uniref:Kinesin motor domain-containing protein n=1 Tax=Phytophthora citrophthora TaxID=4793 RepID=A0AAD9GUR9_9STRA|nr:hypothetical protein P3T76_003522 [Phytophthora citrophthora]
MQHHGGAEERDTAAEGNDVGAPVLSQIHVSCYVTAANRATPLFDVQPRFNSVRVVKSAGSSSSAGGAIAEVMSTMSSDGNAAAEWNFDSVFSSSSPSHAIDFFTEITLPALRTARDGVNSNVVVWGVHPTQKFRLLFGKSVGGGGFAPRSEMAVNDVVELYGQLVGMLHAFFSQLDMGSQQLKDRDSEPWRLGISSWILLDNQSIDLLKPSTAGTMDSGMAEPLNFITLEAPSLASAFRIVQTAKTNRIVRKQNAESVHFFVRLALFHDGQVSTVHLVDLIDQKDFQDDVLIREKLALYNILQSLRQPTFSPRQSGSRVSNSSFGSASTLSSTGKMVLSNFMLPLLTANAKTFLYANVIDSRASLRESVQMLDAVANLKGFACVCKPLREVPFEKLGFQPTVKESEVHEPANQPEKSRFFMEEEARPGLNCLTSSPPFGASPPLPASNSFQMTKQFTKEEPVTSAPVESDAMSWLDTFTQRKRDILGGSTNNADTMVFSRRITERPAVDAECPVLVDDRVRNEQPEQSSTTAETRPSITNLYEQLRESLEDVKEIELGRSNHSRASYCSLHSLPPDHSIQEPLPIVDHDTNDREVEQLGYSRNTIGSIIRQQSEQEVDEELSSWPLSACLEPAEIPGSLADCYIPTSPLKDDSIMLEALKKAGIAPCVLEPPKVDGLDVRMAQKVQAADATLLRKNYDALLSIVREQQKAKEAAEARATEALQDQEEMRAAFEVQIENMKLANVGLRSKVRALENRTSLPQVFEQYEQELRTLQGQVQELQARNVALELRTSGSDASGRVVKVSNGPSTEFKKKYQQVAEEKNALEQELMEYRRRERHHQVHSRLAGESTRRVGQLSRDLNNKEEDLVATRLSKQRMSAEMNQAIEKADQLHHENEKLLQEKAATTEELLATRMYLASLENEKKKASILNHFVEKHGDRMNKLRKHGQSCPKGENWLRDQNARECEDKLLATVKRSLPQAVPLCNKLLRRLEMQELSLREFSEREVDFINLLVDLVSDQPTVSLKQMIDKEMKNLQTN